MSIPDCPVDISLGDQLFVLKCGELPVDDIVGSELDAAIVDAQSRRQIGVQIGL